MKLQKNWLTTEPIDFEYKKYVLLNYQQKNYKKFDDKKLYPEFSELINNVIYVDKFLHNLQVMENKKKGLKYLNLKDNEMVFSTEINDDNLEDVIDTAKYGKEIFNKLFYDFQKLYIEIENSVVIWGSRFISFQSNIGYVIVNNCKKETIYSYDLNVERHPEDLTNYYIVGFKRADEKEYYKDRLTKNVFNIKIEKQYPKKESLLPVLKRKFLHHLLLK